MQALPSYPDRFGFKADFALDPRWKVSPSQMSTLDRCERKWGEPYINGRRTPTSRAMAFGSAMHAQLEDYFRHRKEPDKSPEGRLAAVGLGHYPGWAPKYIEEELVFSLGGVLYRGFADVMWLRPDGTPIVTDHKSTSSPRYALTPETILEHPQPLTYARWAVGYFNTPQIELLWNYFVTRGARRSFPVHVTLDAEEVIERFDRRVGPIGQRISQIKLDNLKVEDLKKNASACGDYGGCPWISFCPLSREEQLETLFKTPADDSVTSLDLLKVVRGNTQPKQEDSKPMNLIDMIKNREASKPPAPAAPPVVGLDLNSLKKPAAPEPQEPPPPKALDLSSLRRPKTEDPTEVPQNVSPPFAPEDIPNEASVGLSRLANRITPTKGKEHDNKMIEAASAARVALDEGGSEAEAVEAAEQRVQQIDEEAKAAEERRLANCIRKGADLLAFIKEAGTHEFVKESAAAIDDHKWAHMRAIKGLVKKGHIELDDSGVYNVVRYLEGPATRVLPCSVDTDSPTEVPSIEEPPAPAPTIETGFVSEAQKIGMQVLAGLLATYTPEEANNRFEAFLARYPQAR